MSTDIQHPSYHVSRIYVNESRFGLCFQTRVGQDDASTSSSVASTTAVSICFKIRKHYSWYSTLEQRQQLQQPISTNDLIFTNAELLATRHVVLLRDSLSSLSAVTLLTPELDYLGIPQGLQAIAVQKIVSEAEASAEIVVDASEHTLITVTWTHATTAYASTEHQPSTSNMIVSKVNGDCCSREVDHDKEEDDGDDDETFVKEVEEEMNAEELQDQQPLLQPGDNNGAEEDPLLIIVDEDHEGVWEPPEATSLRMSIIRRELTGNRLSREHLQTALTLVSVNRIPLSSDNQEIEVEDLSAEESADNDQYNSNGTCPFFIEQLENIKLGNSYDVESKGPCAICMDKFEVGVHVTRLPCLHIYHGDCIVHWLQKSHECPLCRFPMPLSRTLPEELNANTLY